MTTKEEERKAFKDWFDRDAAKALAGQIGAVQPGFDHRKFITLACKDLAKLEFAGRVRQFASAMRATLPASVPDALKTLTQSLPPVLPGCDEVTNGWLQWPVGQFIAEHGLPHFEESMTAMIELTQRFSSEFAVRPFVDELPDRTFARLHKLARHPSPHVRRWCSEGCRPRLPWGAKLRSLVADPSPIWPILETLKNDPEPYVRRSVANNLNDIAKDHPDLVIARCEQWAALGDSKVDRTIRHGLRTLIKRGDPRALAILGFGPPDNLRAILKTSPSEIVVGESVEMSAVLENASSKPRRIAIDYAVHYPRKSGKTSAKVFKWKTLELPASGRTTLKKKHPMKRTTIRALYPGAHRIELQINGIMLAESSFNLR